MNVKELSTMVVSIIVALLVLVTVIVPIVSNAMETSEPITIYNTGTGHTFREARSGDVIQLDSVYDVDTQTKTDTWTLNGKSMVDPSQIPQWDWFLISDNVWGTINSQVNSASGYFVNMSVTTSYGYFGADSTTPNLTMTFEFTDDTISWSSPRFNGSVDYTWAYVMCPKSEGAYLSTVDGVNTFTMSDVDDFVLCGTYSTGELDTNYWYHDNELKIFDADYTGEVKISSSPKSGTYDLYDVSVIVEVSDGTNIESFSPYRVLVPYEVHGYADSGVVHTLLGILPVFVAMGLLIGIGSWIYISRRT